MSITTVLKVASTAGTVLSVCGTVISAVATKALQNERIKKEVAKTVAEALKNAA